MTDSRTAAQDLRRKFERKRRLGRVGLYTTAITAAFLAAFPFLWAAITTFKQNQDLYVKDNNPFWFNLPPTLDHIRLLLGDTNFLVFVRNTVLVGLAVVFITLLLSLPAAYSLPALEDDGESGWESPSSWSISYPRHFSSSRCPG